MTFIKVVRPEEATGRLAEMYGQTIKRAGKVFNILRMMSPNPAVLQASTGAYAAIMFGRSGLSRSRREMIATLVSRANDCFY